MPTAYKKLTAQGPHRFPATRLKQGWESAPGTNHPAPPNQTRPRTLITPARAPFETCAGVLVGFHFFFHAFLFPSLVDCFLAGGVWIGAVRALRVGWVTTTAYTKPVARLGSSGRAVVSS